MNTQLAPVQDVVQGVIYGPKNLPFVLFTRFRKGEIFDVLKVMLQAPSGQSYHLKEVRVKGLFSKRFVLFCENQSGHQIEFSPIDIRDERDGSVSSTLALADMDAKIPVKYIPDDFWDSLSMEKWRAAIKTS